MKIATDTPDLLVLRFTRWKGPLFFGAVSLAFILSAAVLVSVANVPNWMLLAWVAVTAAAFAPLSLLRAERCMLILNAGSGEAELRRRDIRGTFVHRWPLNEVQSTRVTRERPSGPADLDPKRRITLFVRSGMDEGRHDLTKFAVPAKDALAVSARVSDWMRDWRRSLDSETSQA